MNDRPVLVVLSGGQDSTTCLYWALREFSGMVYTITFDYQQRHDAEIDSALTVHQMASSQYKGRIAPSPRVTYIGNVLVGSSPLVNREAALERYKDHASLPGGLEKTFVPARNLLFLTVAANYAHSIGVTDLVTGVCQEDFGGYPDCRQSFIDLARDTIREGIAADADDPWWNFQIHTPLMNLTKADSVRLAQQLPGCMSALAYTHTAYDGLYPPTGKDHASLLRAKGFEEAGVPDPLVVRAWKEGKMTLPLASNYDSVRPKPRVEIFP